MVGEMTPPGVRGAFVNIFVGDIIDGLLKSVGTVVVIFFWCTILSLRRFSISSYSACLSFVSSSFAFSVASREADISFISDLISFLAAMFF